MAGLRTLIALLAVHTGCRVSTSCGCCHHTCGSVEMYDAAPTPAADGPAWETARHNISDDRDAISPRSVYENAETWFDNEDDFLLPPNPVADLEV